MLKLGRQIAMLVLSLTMLALQVTAEAEESSANKRELNRVRKALEAQYDRLEKAVEEKDFEAFQALRTEDFSTVNGNGEPQTPEQMAARARSLLQRIQPPIETRIDIEELRLTGESAVATVWQRFSRMQGLAGRVRKLETFVRQDETWVKTKDGWKLKFVDNVRDGITLVDGKRIDPDKPYDPNAAPFEPVRE